MEIRVLGPIDVIAHDEAVALPGGRVRELLARLTVAGPSAVTADTLVADLWPEGDGRTMTSTVRTYVGRLRNALPEDVVVTRVGGYALDRSRVVVDAEQFEEEVRRARARVREDPADAAALLATALARWRGPALGDVADRDWATAVADRLEHTRLDALELQAEARLEAGEDAATLASHLAELTTAHPLRERLWRHRILALYRSGRQADALAAYRQVRHVLLDELGIEPGAELRELERAVLAQDPTLDGKPHPVAVAPPPVATTTRIGPDTAGGLTTALVGRTVERATLLDLVVGSPVVTLTGPGGVGKSRLADQVGDDLAVSRPVVRVQAAPLASGGLVEAVAAALATVQRGSRPLADLVVDGLVGTDTVLLIDNCEHLVEEAAALVTSIVARAPGVRIVATSREPLAVPAESVFPVVPLGLPPEDAPLAAVLEADAVRLFQARARVVAPAFRVDEDNAASVARICRQLDGLPLAIELAAARVRVLTPADIEVRLHERFALLTGGHVAGRHETLREAVAWSYELLGETDRRAFRRLATFVGAFDVPGAAAVTDTERDDEVIDVLASLIDRSLLVVERHGAHVRYRMLETIRAYGRERLEAEGELVATRHRHVHHMVRLAAHAGELLHGPREAEGHALLVTMRADLRSAMDWCVVAGRATPAARIVAAIPWERVGRWVQWDVTSWACRLVDEDPDLDPDLAARVHGHACVGAWLAGDVDAARRLGDRALQLAEGSDDQTYVEVALAVAWVWWEVGDLERAAMLYLPLADPGLGDRVSPDVAAYCLAGMVLGMVESGLLGSSDDASTMAERLTDAAVELAERSGCPASLALAHLAAAYRLFDHDPVTAEQALRRSASVTGLALPSWALHARVHLARLHAHEARPEDLAVELAAILTEALAAVDELHLRLLGGFVGGALAMADRTDLAPSLRSLAIEVATVPGAERWRRQMADRLGAAAPSPSGPPLAGRELEQAVRTAIDDLGRVSLSTPA